MMRQFLVRNSFVMVVGGLPKGSKDIAMARGSRR